MKNYRIKNSKISPLYQYIRHFSEDSAPSGAGEGIRVGLKKLFNDNSEEAKLLAYQLELLKNHLGGSFQVIDSFN